MPAEAVSRPQPNSIVRKRTGLAAAVPPVPWVKTVEICGFRPLARLMLSVRATGETVVQNGSKTMAKLESFTFTVGMALSSLLMFATILPIA